MARREPATSSRARGKVHSVQAEWLPPAKMVKKLACQLQAEEVAVEEVCQGRDVAILEVVMETAGLLTYSQLEGLGAHTRQVHPEVAGPSHPSAAVVAQPPVVVAWPPHSPLLLVVEQPAHKVSCRSAATCGSFCGPNGHPYPLLCHLWPLLQPPSPPWTFLQYPSHPCPNSCCGFLAALSCLCGHPCGHLTLSLIQASSPLSCACLPHVPKPWQGPELVGEW